MTHSNDIDGIWFGNGPDLPMLLWIYDFPKFTVLRVDDSVATPMSEHKGECARVPNTESEFIFRIREFRPFFNMLDHGGLIGWPPLNGSADYAAEFKVVHVLPDSVTQDSEDGDGRLKVDWGAEFELRKGKPEDLYDVMGSVTTSQGQSVIDFEWGL